jgi:hypothetical protein
MRVVALLDAFSHFSLLLFLLHLRHKWCTSFASCKHLRGHPLIEAR